MKSRISSVRWRLLIGVVSLVAAVGLTLPAVFSRPLQAPVSATSHNRVAQVADVIWPNGALFDDTLQNDVIWPNSGYLTDSPGH